jgi:hypothetical protein
MQTFVAPHIGTASQSNYGEAFIIRIAKLGTTELKLRYPDDLIRKNDPWTY